MSLFVLYKVYKNNLRLEGVYDDIDLCYLYVNHKRTTNHITLFHKRMIDQDDIKDVINHHNQYSNQQCDYVIEEIVLNQNY